MINENTMQYRHAKDGTPISMLAYGCMRFTKVNGKVDLAKAEAEVMEAISLGVNYFDTAYIYAGNESALGEILARNKVRDQVMIATKLPHYLIKTREGLEKTFQEELKRLQTDYVDFYLMHMLTDVMSWERMRKIGIVDWIRDKMESGQIRRIGFSYHGNTEKFCELVDAYDWDFCMIQYNYLDEHSQAGSRGLKYASAKGLPVMIMEPLRGGRLVSLLPQSAKDLIQAHPKGYSAPEWSFRWLWNQLEVTAVLSGMNSLEMVRENCEIAHSAKAGDFTQEDHAFVSKIRDEINHSMKVGCTGCGYCMPCPKGVDIPGTFSAYNAIYSLDRKNARRSYMQCTIFRHDSSSASQCGGCGKCEQHCPQNIQIRSELKQAASELENLKYRVFKFLIRILKLW